MNIGASITLGISVAGFIFGIIYKIVGLSMSYGKLQKTVEKNEEHAREIEKMNSVRIEQLYTMTNAHESSIAALTSSVTALTATCMRIESKLDRLIERNA